MNRDDLHGLLAALGRARAALEEADAELEVIRNCLLEHLDASPRHVRRREIKRGQAHVRPGGRSGG